jgi:histidine triad (HIT) family protein
VNDATKMPTECLFCQIATRRTPAHVIYEDDRLLAFLVLRPIRPGHALIIPKQHFDYFDDLPAVLITPIVTIGQRLAAAMKRIYGVPRAAFLFTGGDLPHAHAHVLPMHEKEDITSRQYIAEKELTFRDVPQMADDELAEIAARLAQHLAS